MLNEFFDLEFKVDNAAKVCLNVLHSISLFLVCSIITSVIFRIFISVEKMVYLFCRDLEVCNKT